MKTTITVDGQELQVEFQYGGDADYPYLEILSVMKENTEILDILLALDYTGKVEEELERRVQKKIDNYPGTIINDDY